MKNVQKDKNKAAAVSFLKLVVAGNIRDAYDAHVSPALRHHNPDFAGDAVSLRKAMEENHIDYPNKIFEVQRTISESDVVAVHSLIRTNREDRGFAVVHLFRFENGQIVEMWSVGEPVPEESPNKNGMF